MLLKVLLQNNHFSIALLSSKLQRVREPKLADLEATKTIHSSEPREMNASNPNNNLYTLKAHPSRTAGAGNSKTKKWKGSNAKN